MFRETGAGRCKRPCTGHGCIRDDKDEVLLAAILLAADSLGLADITGSLNPEKATDFIIAKGNPP